MNTSNTPVSAGANGSPHHQRTGIGLATRWRITLAMLLALIASFNAMAQSTDVVTHNGVTVTNSSSHDTNSTSTVVTTVSAENLGFPQPTPEAELVGIQAFEVLDNGRFVIENDLARVTLSAEGEALAVGPKDGVTATPVRNASYIAHLVDQGTVEVTSGFGPADRVIARLSAIAAVSATVLPAPRGSSAILVEVLERYDGGVDRRVVQISADGEMLGQARVPLDGSRNTRGDVAVGLDGELLHAVVEGDAIVIKRIDMQPAIAPFEAPVSMEEDTDSTPGVNGKAMPAARTRADILTSGYEYVRPQHAISAARLATPASECVVTAGGMIHTRVPPRLGGGVGSGGLKPICYSWGKEDTNASFGNAIINLGRYLGNTYDGLSSALACPGGAAAGVDCSGMASILWATARFSTRTILQSAGTQTGAPAAAKPGDAINKSGHHVVVLARPFSPDLAWVLEATTSNSFDAAVHSVRSISSLTSEGYRAVQRQNLLGIATQTNLSCVGCSGSGQYLTASAGAPLTFTLPTTGTIRSRSWFSDADRTRAQWLKHQQPNPTRSTAANYSRTFGSNELGVHWVSAQALHADGSVTSGWAKVTVSAAPPPPTCRVSSTLAPMTIPAAGGSAMQTYGVQPSGCLPVISGSPIWTSASVSATRITMSASANTGAARSANITLGGRTFAVTQAAAPINPPPPPPSTTVNLSNGAPVANLSAPVGGWLRFAISVPSGATNLTVSASGGSGDSDLYVRRATAPTLTGFDCRPYTSGNAETCSMPSPAAGTWHVGLNAYQAFSGVRLVATYTTGSGSGGGGSCSVTASLPSLSIVAAGGTAQTTFNTSPSNCTPTLTGRPTWLSASSTSTRLTLTAGTNSSSAARSAALTLGGRSFTVTQAGSGPSFFENTADVSIRDHATATSSISVSGRSGSAPANLRVSVRIVHSYIGDLKVELVAPNGSVAVLHNRTGGSADNIFTTFTVNASSAAANGTWRLRVNDNASGDTGYIDRWSLQF
jgi:hypothetical protein